MSSEDMQDMQFADRLEQEPSIDPTMLVDQHELEEIGATFEDPELVATLEGGIDDPDGVDTPPVRHRDDEDGWDLSEPLVATEAPDEG